MRISRVSYGFTKNVGNYQSQRVDVQVDVREGDDPDTALALAVAFTHEALDDRRLEVEERQLLDQLRKTAVLLNVDPEPEIEVLAKEDVE